MNDWNGNGRYDSSDSYLDYKGANSGGGRHSGSGGSGGGAFFLVFIIAAVVGAFNELLGVIILLGYLLYKWLS